MSEDPLLPTLLCVSGPVLGAPGREASLSPLKRLLWAGLRESDHCREASTIPDASRGEVGVVTVKWKRPRSPVP